MYYKAVKIPSIVKNYIRTYLNTYSVLSRLTQSQKEAPCMCPAYVTTSKLLACTNAVKFEGSVAQLS